VSTTYHYVCDRCKATGESSFADRLPRVQTQGGGYKTWGRLTLEQSILFVFNGMGEDMPTLEGHRDLCPNCADLIHEALKIPEAAE